MLCEILLVFLCEFRCARVCVSNPSFWFIQDLVYFFKTSKVIITGLLRMWDTARELVFLWFFATCTENRSCGVGFIHSHAASWLIVHARVITADCIVLPPLNFLTRPWTQQHQMRNSKFGLTSYVSVLCVTRNRLQPPELWWMVSFPPKKCLGCFFFRKCILFFKQSKTWWVDFDLFCNPPYFLIRFKKLITAHIKKRVLRYAWENGCWMWFLGLKNKIRYRVKKHGID